MAWTKVIQSYMNDEELEMLAKLSKEWNLSNSKTIVRLLRDRMGDSASPT